MTTFAVTPTLFVGAEPPVGVQPVYNLTSPSAPTDDVVAAAVEILADPGWETAHHRPAVVVSNTLVAFRVLRNLGLSHEQASERCDFAVRSLRGGTDGRS